MRHSTSLVVLSALIVASCSKNPSAPTPAATQTAPALLGREGTSSTAAVTTDRIRLRRVDGGDIRTNLVTGQVIDVPLNVTRCADQFPRRPGEPFRPRHALRR